MTNVHELLAGLSRESKDEIFNTAAKYAEYSFYRELGKLPASLDKGTLEVFKSIDADSVLQKTMKDILAHKVEQDSHAWIGPPSAHSSNVNPADLFLKGLENVTSGVIGAGGQVLGQKLHPNDPQKQNALGSLFKTAGDVAGALGKAGKAAIENKQLAAAPHGPGPAVAAGSPAAKGESVQQRLDKLLKSDKADPFAAGKSPDAKDPAHKAPDAAKAPDHAGKGDGHPADQAHPHDFSHDFDAHH